MDRTIWIVHSKFLSHKKNDKILSVHIIGAHAGELIGEAVAAMEAGLCAEDIALICHAHPTLSESMKEALSSICNDRVVVCFEPNCSGRIFAHDPSSRCCGHKGIVFITKVFVCTVGWLILI